MDEEQDESTFGLVISVCEALAKVVANMSARSGTSTAAYSFWPQEPDSSSGCWVRILHRSAGNLIDKSQEASGVFLKNIFLFIMP